MTITMLHTGDWHLGDRHGLSPETARALVKEARELSPDLILVAGDIWHLPSPGNRYLRAAQVLLGALAEVAPVVAVSGNHDTPRSLVITHPMQVLSPIWERQGLPLHAVWEGCREVRVLSRSGKTVQVVAVSHSALPEGGEERDLPVSPDPEADLSVLLVHGAVEHPAAPLCYLTGQPGEKIVPRSWWRDRGWGYVALGHYHRPTKVPAGGTRAYYPGSPAPVTWGDWDPETPHGYLWVETGKGVSLRSLPSQPMESLEVGSVEEGLSVLSSFPEGGRLRLTLPLSQRTGSGTLLYAAQRRGVDLSLVYLGEEEEERPLWEEVESIAGGDLLLGWREYARTHGLEDAVISLGEELLSRAEDEGGGENRC